MSSPITWKSIQLGNVGGGGTGRRSGSFEGESLGALARASRERRVGQASGGVEAALAALTNPETYQEDAARIMADARNQQLDMGRLAKFKTGHGTTLQNRSATAQNMKAQLLDMAAQEYRNRIAPNVEARAQAMHDENVLASQGRRTAQDNTNRVFDEVHDSNMAGAALTQEGQGIQNKTNLLKLENEPQRFESEMDTAAATRASQNALTDATRLELDKKIEEDKMARQAEILAANAIHTDPSGDQSMDRSVFLDPMRSGQIRHSAIAPAITGVSDVTGLSKQQAQIEAARLADIAREKAQEDAERTHIPEHIMKDPKALKMLAEKREALKNKSGLFDIFFWDDDLTAMIDGAIASYPRVPPAKIAELLQMNTSWNTMNRNQAKNFQKQMKEADAGNISSIDLLKHEAKILAKQKAEEEK